MMGVTGPMFEANTDAKEPLTQEILLEGIQKAFETGFQVPDYTVIVADDPAGLDGVRDRGERVKLGDDPQWFYVDRVNLSTGMAWLVKAND